MNQIARIGFAGIGLMGRPLVHRLLAAGYAVDVWNRSRDKLADVVTAGATAVATPAALREHCDVVMLCLADTDAVRNVIFGPDGLANDADAPNPVRNALTRLVVDLSSIDPAATQEMARRLFETSGIGWADTPMSGGVPGAEQGTLAIMAGGHAEDIDGLRPLMETISQRFTHMGPTGAGQITKLCNQMIVGCNVLAIAEVMGLARRAGIDAGRLPAALAGGFADSTPLQMTGPMMAAGETEPVRWHVRTLLKDLDTANSTAAAFDGETPLTALAAKLLRAHGDSGFLDADPATLVQRYLETGALPDEDE